MVIRMINQARIYRFASKPVRQAVLQLAVSAALKEQKQVDVDKKKIALSDPIRALGEYTIRMSIYENTFANIKVIVEKC